MTNLDSILKSRDITLSTKVHLVKTMVFSGSHVWIWELDYKESWALKNWGFSTAVLEKTLKSPLDSKKIQPVHPKGINPEYSLEGLMLKLKLQYFGHLMRRADSLEKTLMLEKIEGWRRRGWQRMRWWMASPTEWTWVRMSSGSWWWTGRPGVLQCMGRKELDTAEWLTHCLCPSLSPRVCSNSYPLSWWCYLTISSSAAPFSFCLQSFPGSFPVSQLFASDGQSIGASASALVFLMNIQGWFL